MDTGQIQAIFTVSAGDVRLTPLPAARAAVRRRVLRLHRRRRVRHTIGSGTLAAGLFAGTYGVPRPSRAEPAAAAAVPAGPTPVAPPGAGPIDPGLVDAVEPGSGAAPASWSWDAGGGTAREAPDPGAFFDGDTLHVVTTSARHCGVSGCTDHQVPHLVGAGATGPGHLVGDAMPSLPAWVDPGEREIWAPQLARAGDGDGYLLYFTATAGAAAPDHEGLKCLGVATSPALDEPFVPRRRPLRCSPGHWNIDPYPVTADGRRYLLWRHDDADHPTGSIVAAELRPDGLSLVPGTTTTLLAGEHPWEDGRPGEPGIGPIENPALVRHPDTGQWLLTWSANLWETRSYATGLAVCTGPLGPCDRVDGATPWARTSDDPSVVTPARFAGAGGLSFAAAPDGRLYAVLHAYADDVEWPSSPRVAWLFRVDADPAGPAGPAGTGYRLVGDGDGNGAEVAGNRPGSVSVSGS